MSISEKELADFIFEISMKQGNATITRNDAWRMALVMISAAKTTELVLADVREAW